MVKDGSGVDMLARITDRLGVSFLAAYTLLIYAFIFLPVCVLVVFSFQGSSLPIPPFNGPSLKWYSAVFSDRRLLESLWHSIIVATSSSLIAIVFGFLAAYGLSRFRMAGRQAMQLFLMAPITVSYLIIAMGLLITFKTFGIPKSMLAIIIGHSIINLPLCFGILYSQLGDHQANIERAARDLGAAEWQVLLHVTIPMLWPAFAAAFFLSVTLSWDEFIIAFLVSRFDVTLPVEIWGMLRSGLNPKTNAIGSFVFLVSMALVFIVDWIVFQRRHRT